MSRHALGRSAVLLPLVALGCAYTIFGKPQPLLYSPPDGVAWQHAFHSASPGSNVTIDEYVREGDDIADWGELVTVVRVYDRHSAGSRRKMYEGLQKVREEECPGSTRWNVVEDTKERLMFESWGAPCRGFPEHYEIAVLVDGKRDRIKLSYTLKGSDVDPGVREGWVTALRGARMVDPKPD